MSRKILCLLLSVASLGMFSSCKDEGGNGGGPTDLSQQIVGVYKGDMRVEVPLLSYDRTSLQKIYLTSSGENLAKLELRDFSFGLPGEEIPVGDIVVEDIVDTGESIEYMICDLKAQKPASLEVCTLFFKPGSYRKQIPIKYRAMEIGNEFIVGYGLDYDQLGRSLKDIYVVTE